MSGCATAEGRQEGKKRQIKASIMERGETMSMIQGLTKTRKRSFGELQNS